MIKLDENALMCDLAETYHIYDYRQLPASKVAVFSLGLRDNSRIKKKLSNQPIDFDRLLLAGISDKLSYLLWSKTKDGAKGRNKPKSILEMLTETKKQSNQLTFNSGEEFEQMRARILAGGDTN
ncbi:DUF5361 domain-containing protein [Enterococcus italicus]